MNEEEKLENLKHRIEQRFYSNALNFSVSNSDVCIDFFQLPAENDEVPTMRIYLSHEHMRRFFNVLKSNPFFQETIKEQ